MDKQVIGIFRVLMYLAVIYLFGNNIPGVFEVKLYISEWIHGDITPEHRNSGSVSVIMFVILGIASFYILQTVIYVFIGGALNNRNTSILNLIRHIFRSLKEIGQSKNFWTSGKEENDYEQIRKIMKYRDNKMALMNNAEAAKLLKETGSLDQMYHAKDLPQYRKTLSYINNKAAFMTNEQALDYIRTKK